MLNQRGRASKDKHTEYDFCSVQRIVAGGRRHEDEAEAEPLAWPEYEKWYTLQAPSYQLLLGWLWVAELSLRLSAAGAKSKWWLDMANPSVRKDQAEKLDDSGRPSGKLVARLQLATHPRFRIFVPCKFTAKVKDYQDGRRCCFSPRSVFRRTTVRA